MAAQPFDKETIDKITSAFNNLNSETTKTLSQLEASVEAEKQMVDIAKQLGQVYKTQQDKLNDQLKGKNLQEKLQEKLKNSEKELADFAQARINSFLKINSLQEELNATSAQLLIEQNKDPHSDKVKQLLNTIQLKEKELNLEKDLLKSSKDTLDVMQEQVDTQKSLNDILGKTVGLIGDAMAELKIPTSFSGLLKQTYEIFKEIDKVTTEVRKKFALFRSDAQDLEKSIRETSISMADLGVNATDVAETVTTLGKEFSYVTARNESLVKSVLTLNKQFGISADTSAKFLKTLGGISGSSAQSKVNMLSLAGAAAKAYGVGLDEVMKDVSEASDDARMYAGRNADEMVRAAAQARQMGTTLDNMVKTSKGLLNFETSIQSELKASALIGKNINFNEARRLAFNKDTIGANKLILEQAKKIKFNQLNPIAQEAFAAAAGKSVKELQDMLEAETRIKDALNSQDPVVRKIAQEKLKEQQSLKTNSKLAQQKFEQDLKTQKNQERLAVLQSKISQQLQKLMLPTLEAITKAADVLVDVFDKFKPEELIGPLIKIKLMFGKFGTILRESLLFPLRVAGGYLSKLGEVGWIKNLMSPITNLVNNVKKFIGNFEYARSLGSNFSQSFLSAGDAVGGIFQKIGSLFSKISKPVDGIISTFKTVKSVISSIFSPISNAIKPIFEAFKSVGEGSKFLKPLLGFFKIGKVGIKAVPIVGEIIMAIEFIYNAWKRISAIFNDPKLNIGQKIFASIVGLYGAVYDTLIQPFIDIGEWIIKAVWGEKILNGIKASVSSIFETLKSPFVKAYDWIMDMLGGKSPSKIGLAIVDGIKSIVDMLFDLITYPFKKATQIIPEMINILKTTFVDAFKSIVDVLFDLITYPFEKAAQIIPEMINILKTKFVDAFKSIVDMLFDLITYPFKKAAEIIPEMIDTLKTKFVDAFKSIVDMLFDLITYPFKKAAEIIPEMIDTLKTTFVDAFKSIVDVLFDLITYPFKKAAEIIPEMIDILKTTYVDAFKSVVDVLFDLITYPFEKAFQLIKSTVSEVGSVLKDTFSGAFTFIINALEKVLEKLKGVGEFITGLVGKGFKFVGKILGVTDEPTDKSTKVDEKYKQQGLQTDSIINAIVSSNKAVVEKLDKLTSMMASGQIAVYIDGQRANQLLATSNSKFGSFGQATTN